MKNILILQYKEDLSTTQLEYEILKSIYSDKILSSSINISPTESDEGLMHMNLKFEYNFSIEDKSKSIIKEIIHELYIEKYIHKNDSFIYLPYEIYINLKQDFTTEKPNQTELFLIFEVNCSWMKREISGILSQISEEIEIDYESIDKMSILFNIIEKIKERIEMTCLDNKNVINFLLKVKEEHQNENRDIEKSEFPPKKIQKLEIQTENQVKNQNLIDYNSFLTNGGKQGDTIIDRKSIFQAHIIKLTNVEDVDLFTKMLLTNKKIEKATHNIIAYRTYEKKKLVSGFDDDGETKAGERLLELLNQMKVDNVYVMVSRWFGGIKLGAERFKHINDSAKNTLQKYDFI
jgi:hypothetical protein